MGFLDLFKSKSKESADKTLSLIIFDLESLGYELPDLKFLTGRSQVVFWLFYRKPVPHLQKRLSEWGRVESFDEEKGRTLELVVGYELGQNPNYKEVILVTAEGKREGIQSFFKDKGINFQHMRTGGRAQSRSGRSEPTAKSRASEAASHNASRVGMDPKSSRPNDGKTSASRYERQETHDDLRPDPRLERGELYRDLRPDPRMPSIEPKTPARTDANRKDRPAVPMPKPERTALPTPRYDQTSSPPKPERTALPTSRYDQTPSPPKPERTSPRYDDHIANDTHAAPDDFYPRPHTEERPFWEWDQEHATGEIETYAPPSKNERSRNVQRSVEPNVHSPVQAPQNDRSNEPPFEFEPRLPFSQSKRSRGSQPPVEPYPQTPAAHRDASHRDAFPETEIQRPRKEPPLSSVPVPYADVITSGQTLPPLDPTRKIKPDPKNYEPTAEDFRKIALHFYNRFPAGEVFSKSFLGMAINQATGRTLQEIFKTKSMRPILAYMVQAGYIEEVDNQNFRLLSPPPVQAFVEARNFALQSLGMA